MSNRLQNFHDKLLSSGIPQEKFRGVTKEKEVLWTPEATQADKDLAASILETWDWRSEEERISGFINVILTHVDISWKLYPLIPQLKKYINDLQMLRKVWTDIKNSGDLTAEGVAAVEQAAHDWNIPILDNIDGETTNLTPTFWQKTKRFFGGN